METSYLLAVAWIWVIATMSPGPNFLVIAQMATSRSRLLAFVAVCGTGVATAIWGVCGLLGVHTIFVIAPWAYVILKVAGALYLIYSGLDLIVRAKNRVRSLTASSDPRA